MKPASDRLSAVAWKVGGRRASCAGFNRVALASDRPTRYRPTSRTLQSWRGQRWDHQRPVFPDAVIGRGAGGQGPSLEAGVSAPIAAQCTAMAAARHRQPQNRVIQQPAKLETATGRKGTEDRAIFPAASAQLPCKALGSASGKGRTPAQLRSPARQDTQITGRQRAPITRQPHHHLSPSSSLSFGRCARAWPPSRGSLTKAPRSGARRAGASPVSRLIFSMACSGSVACFPLRSLRPSRPAGLQPHPGGKFQTSWGDIPLARCSQGSIGC